MISYQLRVALLLASILLLAQCRATPIRNENARQASQHPEPIAPSELTRANGVVSEMLMPGEYMKVFDIAYSAFLTDNNIPVNKRMVENYRVELRQNDENYQVAFIAKRNQSELSQVDGGSSDLGKDVTYLVDKRTFQMVRGTIYK